MENFFTRYRNVTLLLGLLMVQIIVLATQVRRPEAATGESMSLLRSWVVGALVPGEKAIASVGSGVRNLWKNYIDLREVRAQNEDLKSQLDRLRLEEVALAEDAGQARRLQALLAFKEKFIAQTVAAQVIGTSGTERSRVLYIDKGSRDGLKVDMPVITPQGVVGKINKVFSVTSQILQINDATAGAGVMLERSRLRGVLHGTASGIPEILHIMADEKIERGDPVVTSGGDQIYPRGLPIGTVFNTGSDPEGVPFMVVRVKPSANLDKVEEVLVITKIIDKEPTPQETTTTLRAADVLAQRLPTVTPKPPAKQGEEPPPTSALYARRPTSPAAGTTTAAKSGTGQGTAPKTTAPPTVTAKRNTENGASTTPSAAANAAAPPKNPKAPKPERQPPDRNPQENPR